MSLIITVALLLLPLAAAQAYLDPGSGSFIIQLVVGAVLGSLVAVKMYFKNIKRSVSKLFSKKAPQQNNPDEQQKNG